MIQTLFTNPIYFLGWLIALIVGITVHEFAHAYSADRLGDPTPRSQGRVTLNPLKHLDPIGTLMILIVRFGWGKPVQFDPANLRNPKRDAAIISVAGPASNLVIAILSSLVLYIMSYFVGFDSQPAEYVVVILLSMIQLNIILAIFNMLPVHPLDGFKIVAGFLSPSRYEEWMQLQPYGIFILIILLIPFGSDPLISRLIGPVIEFLTKLLIPNIFT